jgi:hypothetical protein
MDFKEFGKIARFSREVIITEKIDGTNGLIAIGEDGEFKVGSRTRWIAPEKDNYGFAKWALANKDELMKLGPGYHYGEWWGQGIQRGYGLKEKRFSLFNTGRWNAENVPGCCSVVPVLWVGVLGSSSGTEVSDILMQLENGGSHAAPGFTSPEGIVIYHTAGNCYFKKTIFNDDVPKGQIK